MPACVLNASGGWQMTGRKSGAWAQMWWCECVHQPWKQLGITYVLVIVWNCKLGGRPFQDRKRVAFQIENTRFSKSCFTSQTKSWTTGQSLVLKTPHWWTPNWAFSMPVCVLSLSMVPGPEVVYGPRCCGVSVCTNLENNWVSPMFCDCVNL